jgi:hypothetical protein
VLSGAAYLFGPAGLVGWVSDPEREQTLRRERGETGPPWAAVAARPALRAAATVGGGHDNITAVLLTIGEKTS